MSGTESTRSVGAEPGAGRLGSDAAVLAGTGRDRRAAAYRWLRLLGPPLAFLGYALHLAWPFAVNPERRLFPVTQGSDQVLAEWFLAHTAYALTHLHDPFATNQLNAPVGVDLIAQVSMVGVGVPLTPITLLFGAPVSYLLVVLVSMAGTATAWYWLLYGKLGLHWLAGLVGAACCAFTPQLMVEATGRNHVTLQVLVPVIVWQVTQLGRPDHPVRRGVVLGLLIVWQALIGEEILLLTALGLAVFCVAYLALRPDMIRLAGRYARGLGIAAAVALPLLAYPLWRQFFGANHPSGFPLELKDYAGFVSGYTGMPQSWANLLPGTLATTAWWSVIGQPTLGLPLLALLLGTVLVLHRRPVVVASFVVLIVFAVLSLGDRIRLGPHGTVPGPWALVSDLPVLSVAVPYRLALVPVAAAGVIVAYAVDATYRTVAASLRRRQPDGSDQGRAARVRRALLAAGALFAVGTLLGLATVQLRPSPLPAADGPAIPRFITSGGWRPYVTGGRTLVSVPLPSSVWLAGMRWSTATTVGFAIPRGYFIGQDTARGKALFGASPTWTSRYLDSVAASGKVPAVSAADRDRFTADLRRWRAGVLVLDTAQPNAEALRHAVQQVLGEGQRVQDVWVWDVRGLT